MPSSSHLPVTFFFEGTNMSPLCFSKHILGCYWCLGKFLEEAGFVELTLHFIIVLPLIYYMTFGGSFAFLYLSFHLEVRF